jgi:hypothetical protein
MADIPATRPEPAAVPVPPVPASVRYAQVVLFLQGSIWALGAIGGVIVAVVGLAGVLHGRLWVLLAVAIGWVAVTGGMATLKMLLTVRLGRGRSRRVRKAVIVVEVAMTCFGVLWFSTPYSGPLADLAGFAGACLSLAAALALMRRGARQYAESDAVNPEVTDRGPASGPMSFWRHSALAGA